MKDGYLIQLFRIISIQDGIVNEEGEAVYTVQFKALVFKPLKGEVIDGIVTSVNKPGIHLKIGSVSAFIPHNKIPDYFKYDEENNYFVNPAEQLNTIEARKVCNFYF
jgi:DNA-directed RNA polymerase subunit E'/Rpb7